MAIQNKPVKPKANSKTAAMKALANAPADTTECEDSTTGDQVAVRPTPAPIVRPAPSAPPVVRPQPIRTPLPARPIPQTEDTEGGADDVEALEVVEETPPSGKVAFDPLLWQWRDEGGFVHIKTGELREESEFLDPDEKTHDDSGEWDEPQASASDW